MLREEEKDQAPSLSWKTYSRSISWTERSPRKPDPKPRWNSKARACLPPLQPLSIARPSIEEWPRAGSDDLGIWPNPPTPGARPGALSATADKPPREFECRKDKLAFFDKECSKVLDHIYLGSDAIAKDRETLRQRGITHVLNCVGFVCAEYFKNELVYKTLWLQDSPSEDITSILYDVFDYFEDVREQGGRVLVHCCHGVSRSTSLVIAYLMWKERKSFDDAFQCVKAAREVANPNVGFACQLLLCQKRVHALPASPSSFLRMYRMAPHSAYDPLHLVPKMLCEPGSDRLDSRGAFIVHIPSALYVWIGRHCSPMMSENAMTAASQVIRYERANGPVITIKEGEETFEFWDVFSNNKNLEENLVPTTVTQCLNQRKLDEYDLDFEIFHRALAGRVEPSSPLSEAGLETCLPTENILRKKSPNAKLDPCLSQKDTCTELEDTLSPTDLSTSSTPCVSQRDTCTELEDALSPAGLSTPSSSQNDSQESFASCAASSLGSDASPLGSPSYNLVDSFLSIFVSKQRSSWSDLSFASALPSPYTLESDDTDPSRSDSIEDQSLDPVHQSICLRDSAMSTRSSEGISDSHVSREESLCSTSGQTLPSLVGRRGRSFPSLSNLPSIQEEALVPENLPRDLDIDGK